MLFIGREKELKLIQERMDSEKFEFGIVYGRRRVGKTRLINEAIKGDKGIYFVASEMHLEHNIAALSERVAEYFNEPTKFSSIEDIFKYLVHKSKDKRVTLIIDEFTYLLEGDPGVQSVLQNIIDSMLNENFCLILSGSHVGMIEDVLSYKKPLYGRATFKLELKPFDYYDSSLFYPNYSNEDKVIAYSVFGGIPHYLSLVDESKTIRENIIDLVVSDSGVLHDEVDFIIRQELRSVLTYKMVLDVVAGGTTRLNEISTKAKVNNTGNTSTYLTTLNNLDLVERVTPFNSPDNSRRSIYKIKDNFVSFTYKFLYKNKSALNVLPAEVFYDTLVEPNLNRHVSFVFEKVCKEYLIRNNDGTKQELFFNIGTYWGNNPVLKQEVELDILTSNESGITVYECKWTNSEFGDRELTTLKNDSSHLKPIKYGAFSYSGFSKGTKDKLDYIFELGDLFNGE